MWDRLGRETGKYNLDISCIVLAGGKGSRLGQNKITEVIGNKNLLERVVSCLSSFNKEIVIVTATAQPLAQLVDHPDLRIVTDTYPGKGSLGGIYTGLAASDSFYNLVVACDMPFLNRALLSYMIRISAGYDLTIPRVGKFVEPLHAIYSRDCLAHIEELFKQGNLRVSELLNMVRVRYVEVDEIDRFDPKHLSFFNINTKAELRMAQELAAGDKKDDKC
jgi:molybdopterin-guanine dinucleotide biosynthesis protein A